MTDPSNRRVHPRLPVNLTVRVAARDAGELAQLYATNISRGGVFLRVRQPSPIGTMLQLEVQLLDGTPAIRATGVVRFVQPEDPNRRPPVQPGMGIEFVDLDPGSSKLIDDVCTLVAQRLQQPRPTVPEVQGTPPPTRAPLPPVSSGHTPGPVGSMGAGGPRPGFTPGPAGSTGHGPGSPARPGATPGPRGSFAAAPGSTPRPGLTPGPPNVAARPTAAPGSAAARAPVVAARPAAITRLTLGLPGLDPGYAPPRDGPVIGIDLGTTYSCAAAVRNGKAVTLPSREGYSTIPSIIAVNSKGRLVVGHPAKGQMLTNPEHTVYGSKRLVGRMFSSPVVRAIKERFLYDIVEGPGGEAAVRLAGTVLTLQEVSALILKEVREQAQDALGEPVHRATITCPAYYNDLQRQAVREAGRLAGLHVERIVNEPIAAGVAYGYGRGMTKRVLIYDLGGGTFDVSVLELHDNVAEVVSTGGDTFLGGVDFDNALIDHLLTEFQRNTGKHFDGDRVALQRIADAAERTRCVLSERENDRVMVPFVTLIDGAPFHLDVSVTRAKLEEITRPLVERTLAVCDEALRAKTLTIGSIDDLVLVGGMSRMPLVRKLLEDHFQKDAKVNVHPEEAVALGAALLGHSAQRVDGMTLIDVCPITIGLGLPGGRFQPIVERNTTLPVSRSWGVATTVDDQAALEVHVFQGEHPEAAKNEYLGTVTLSGLPKAPRGVVKVAVKLDLSAECLLAVTARELSSGRAVNAVMSTRSTPETVRRKLGLAEVPTTNSIPGLEASDGKAVVDTPSGGGLKALFRKLAGKK